MCCLFSIPGAHHKSHLLQLQHVRPNPLSSAAHCTTTTSPHIHLLYPTPESTCAVTSTSSQSPKPLKTTYIKSPQMAQPSQILEERCTSMQMQNSSPLKSRPVPQSWAPVYIQNVERDGCTYSVSKQPNPFISPAFKFRISLSSFAQHHNFFHTLATMHHAYCVICMCHFHELSTPKPLKLLTSPNKDGLTQWTLALPKQSPIPNAEFLSPSSASTTANLSAVYIQNWGCDRWMHTVWW